MSTRAHEQTSTEPTPGPNPLMRIRVPPEVEARVADASAAWTRADGAKVDHGDAARRLVLIGLREVERCLVCVKRRPCAEHGPEAGVEPGTPPGTTPALPGFQREPAAPGPRRGAKPAPAEPPGYAETVKVYFDAYERARGVKPTFRAAEGKAVKRLLADVGEERAKLAIENAYRDPFWKTKITILMISADPSRSLGKLSTPGTLQQPEAGPNGGWKPAPEHRL